MPAHKDSASHTCLPLPLPLLQLLLQRLMSSLWLPPTSILQWLEEHAQLRLSLLLTYLFGKSEMFVQLMRWSGNVARVSRGVVSQAWGVQLPPLLPVAMGPSCTARRCG